MKNFKLLLMLLVCSAWQMTALAQGYNSGSIAYSKTTLGTPTTVSLGDDQVSGAIPIGFNFEFFSISYSDIYISSNGFVTFLPGQSNGCCSGQFLPSAGGPNGLIAAYWTDLYPPNGVVSYQLTGSGTSHVFIVEYASVPRCCGITEPTSFQIKLFESSNRIEIHTELATLNNSNSNSQGIENETGTDAYFISGRNETDFSLINDGVFFQPSTATGVHNITTDVGTDYVKINWVVDDISIIKSYTLERSTDGVLYSFVDQFGGDIKTAKDVTVASNTTYFYHLIVDLIAGGGVTFSTTATTLGAPGVISDQEANQLAPFNFTFSSSTFPGGGLTYTATKSDGKSLPTWLSFNAATRTFSGVPGRKDQSVEVRVTATNGAGNFSSVDFKIKVNVITGDLSSINPTISIYPNPFTNSLRIKNPIELGGLSKVLLYSTSGQELAPVIKTIDEDEIEMETSSLGAGLYIVEIRSSQDVIRTKVVKK